MPSRARGSSRLAELALALGATALAFGALEIALRVFDVRSASYHAIGGFTVYDPELGWRLAPSREVTFRGAHFAVHVSQNAEGLRDRHYGYAREPGRSRILVLGDSFVWCWGVELADCFTERLEAALPATDVVNAGVPAWSTAQELLFYEREGRRYAPDLVLLVFVANDPWENVAGPGPHFTLAGDRLVPPARVASRRKTRIGEWLQARSRVWQELGYLVTVAQQLLRPGTPSLERIGTALTARPASAAQGEPVRPDRLLTEALLDRLAADVHRDGARFAIVLEKAPRPMAAWLHDFAAGRAIPLLDLGPVLSAAEAGGEKVRLTGDPHLASAGQEVVAREVLGFVTREGLLAPTPRSVSR